MRRCFWLPVLVVLGGCAHGKIGKVHQPLARNVIDKSTPIFVESVLVNQVQFTGDKADDVKRTTEEKDEIRGSFHLKIAEQLRKRGYNAIGVNAPVTTGIVISGDVTKIEHGSGATRFFVGMGAGSANMFTDFKIEDRAKAKTLAKFQVIATSGGNSYSGSFLDSHLIDGSLKVADYVEGRVE